MLKSGTFLLAALVLAVTACNPDDLTPTAVNKPPEIVDPGPGGGGSLQDPQRRIEVVKPNATTYPALYSGMHVDVGWLVVEPCGEFYVDVYFAVDNDTRLDNGVLFGEAVLTNAKNAKGCCYNLPEMVGPETCFIVAARDRIGPMKTVVYRPGPLRARPPHNPPPEWNEP